MTLQNPSALYLLFLTAGIILLYFLRARSRRYEVSALFLWEGLRSDPRSRAAQIRRRIEPLLIVQLLLLALVTLALADPGIRGERPHLSAMAIVLDASASMQARTESGKTCYDLAREEGLALLDRYPTTPITILQLARAPQVLVPLTEDHEAARRALASSQPTWLADGSPEALQGLLESQGGTANFERIVLLTDRSLETVLPGMEEMILESRENLAITAFNVREEEDLQGSTAFLKVRNDTASYQEVAVGVSDGAHRALLSVLLPPGTEQAYVLPFPGSRGPVFTATIEPEDDFPADDTRYFALNRPLNRRVRLIGEANRYLEAALAAAGPITLVSNKDLDPVDLTVAYNTILPTKTVGNILLVHAGLEGLVTLGEEVEDGDLAVASPNDPFLAGVDPLNFRILSTPQVKLPDEGTTVLTLGEEPLLYRLEKAEWKLVLIAPDLMRTNLPLTVDFPLLMRNILERFSLLPAPVTHTWSIVGEVVRIDGYGAALGLVDPDGREIPLAPGASTFIPQGPGIYTLKTDRGTYPLAVNVDPAESALPGTPAGEKAAGPVKERAQTLLPLWPYLAGLAFLFLLVESALYHGVGLKGWQR